ncbi:rhodanese-like domain-containing protein [Marinimicrobium alkaliphilum]|uniref:rhodanese-like domain-containing protein n=1 Tax=Marinimicrobium alkaliphilum TaxID=2202654 RepID=UPI001E5FDC1C|nr:rhodanese-like domain-containing protein [Marinimicrobium alkaliphilum]
MDFFVFISEQWLLVSGLLVLIYVYAMRERIKNGRPVSAHEVTQLLNKEQAVLLDVRDAADFNAGHISGAIHIPHSKVKDQLAQLEQYKTRTIVIADKLGQHAGSVGRMLGSNGFDVRRLAGGVAEWRSQNLPLVKA